MHSAKINLKGEGAGSTRSGPGFYTCLNSNKRSNEVSIVTFNRKCNLLFDTENASCMQNPINQDSIIRSEPGRISAVHVPKTTHPLRTFPHFGNKAETSFFPPLPLHIDSASSAPAPLFKLERASSPARINKTSERYFRGGLWERGRGAVFTPAVIGLPAHCFGDAQRIRCKRNESGY